MKKETWYVHSNKYNSNHSENCSISTDPKCEGWCTDSGATGYGIPRDLALWICDKLNASKDNSPYQGCWMGWEKI